jgi:hypothetical protein
MISSLAEDSEEEEGLDPISTHDSVEQRHMSAYVR